MGPEQQQRTETPRTGNGKGNICTDKPERIGMQSAVTLHPPVPSGFYIIIAKVTFAL